MAAPGEANFETDLSHWYRFAQIQGEPPGTFTTRKKLQDANNDSVVLLGEWRIAGAAPAVPGEYVVAKKIPRARVYQNQGKETHERTAFLATEGLRVPAIEDNLTEIGILRYLRDQPDLPLFIHKMLNVFVDGNDIMLITEHVHPGELLQQVITGLELPEERIRRYTWQLLRAVRYLHFHRIGHRDISLENILITFRENTDGHLRLMDFGAAASTHSSASGAALRYFRSTGKAYYRSPEMVVPKVPPHMIFQTKVPEAATPDQVNFLEHQGYLVEVVLPPAPLGETCKVELVGYEIPPADIFACGVSLFILAHRNQPWGCAMISDPGFKFVHRKGCTGIPALLRHWKRNGAFSELMAELIVWMTSSNPVLRPSVDDCLQHAWLEELANTPVPTHI